MNTLPETFPNGSFLIADDAECIRILADEGVLDKVRPYPPHNQASFAFARGDHWCLATCHNDSADDGYTIVFLPKNRFTKEQAGEFFAGVLNECSTNKQFEFVTVTICPAHN